jgi:uncharacterized protein (TIGR03435 family)
VRVRIIGNVAAVVLVVLAARPAQLSAQAGPTLEPIRSFDVVSVKLNPSRTRTPMVWQPGGRFVMGLPIFSLVSGGYGVPGYRIEGLPEWTRTTFFDINAQAGRQPAIEERAAYYRGLLVDRFKLVAHVERREMDVYVLTLARSDGRLGPNLRRSDVNCDAAIAAARTRSLAGERPEPPAPGVRPTCGAVGGGASLTGDAVQLTILIGMLAGALGRPVVDNTGLTGRFDIDFRAAPPQAGPGVAGSRLAELPPLFTAVEDQLGLKLVQGRAPIEVLVIDRLEMPSEN